MALILALDSSTDACSVALNLDGHLTHQFELAAKSHTQRLLPMVDELLSAQGLGLHDVHAIAFGRGPGSFTGLRICMGIVQGLAFGANLPVIPVSTLEAMALGFYRANPLVDLPLAVALDARMNEIYVAAYQKTNQSAVLMNLLPEAVIDPSRFVMQSSALQPKEFIGVGSGWHYAELQALTPQSVHLDVYPSAENIALLAAHRWAQGQTMNVLDAEPVYLRDSVSWQKRQRIRPVDDSTLPG